MNHHCRYSLSFVMLWQWVPLDLLLLGQIKGPICDFFMKHPPKSLTISGLMMHILVIVTIIRTLLIFIRWLSTRLDDPKDSINYPLLNYHFDFFVSTQNRRQLLLFYAIVPFALYPCCWSTTRDGKSLMRASFFCFKLVSNR